MLDLRKLIIDVFDPQKGENVIILNDFPSNDDLVDDDYMHRREMVEQWHDAFSALGRDIGFTVEPILVYEPTGAHGKPLPEKGMQDGKAINIDQKLKTLGAKDIVCPITRFSATGPIDGYLLKQKFRMASMPGAHMGMTAFQADYKVVAKKSKVLAKKLTGANAAVVTFSTGHEMYFDLRDRKATPDDGMCNKPGFSINLPSGETFIAPVDTRGSKSQGYIPVYYDKHLFIYEVRENKIIDVVTDSPKSKEMQMYFSEDPARGNIAELGLGCNDKAEFINNVLQDEKIEGMHWAYGYNDYMGGTIGVKDFNDPAHAIHVDIIYTKAARIKIRQIQLVYPDKSREVIMENSRYSFNIQKEFEN